MNCKFCGKELDEGAAFCPECGKSVNEVPAPTEVPAPAEAPAPAPAPAPTVSPVEKIKAMLNHNIVGLILGTVIILIGIVRLMDSSVSVSSTSFGADFYTYSYKGIVACANLLGSINKTLSWALISFGAYIDFKAAKGYFDKK